MASNRLESGGGHRPDGDRHRLHAGIPAKRWSRELALCSPVCLPSLSLGNIEVLHQGHVPVVLRLHLTHDTSA